MTGSAATHAARVRPAPSRRRTGGLALRLSWGGARFACFCAEYVIQTKGRWARRPLYLEPWQLEVESEMLRTSNDVWVELTQRDIEACRRHPDLFYERLRRTLKKLDAEPGVRVYREAYLQEPKKTGKSTKASAHALYFLVADGEEGAEVYSAAAAKDQARIVFGQAREVVLASPRLHDWVRVLRDALVVDATNSVYRVLAADAALQEGLNPHASVIDELHRHKSRDLYDVLTSGDIAREQPFTLVITNAGADLATICGELYEQAKAVIERQPGARDDLYAFVPELSAEETDQVMACDRRLPHAPPEFSAAKKVNPASWITVPDLWRNYRKYPAFVFQRRHLNMWTGAEESWLPPGAWDACLAPELTIDPGDEIVIGLDVGVKRDTTGRVIACAKGGRIVVRAKAWGVHTDHDKPPPPAHVVITDSDSVSYSFPEEDIRQLAREYALLEVAYDPWRFSKSAEDLRDEGIEMVEYPQSNERMCPASQTLFDLIVDGTLAHDGDPILRAHIEAAAPRDTGRGWRLEKRRARRPCDLAIALVIAVDRLRASGASGGPGLSISWL